MDGHRIEITPADGIAQVFLEGRAYVERAAMAFRRLRHREPKALLVEPCGKMTDIREFLSHHA